MQSPKRSLIPGALLAVLLLASRGPAYASFPGTNGKIAFTSDGGLHVVNPDGTGETVLVAAGTHRWHDPAWSADGTTLVFVDEKEVAPGWHLWILDAGSTTPRALAAALSGIPTHPSWSPDGSKIVLAVEAASGVSSIWVVPADASAPPTVLLAATSNEQYRMPSWSPDGATIALIMGDLNTYYGFPSFGTIGVVNADGTHKHVLVPEDHSGRHETIDWSPNGRSLVYGRLNGRLTEVWRTDFKVSDGYSDNLLNNGTNAFNNDTMGTPSWSPDGNLIGLAGFEVYTMSPTDGSAFTQVTSGVPALNAREPAWQPVPTTPVGPTATNSFTVVYPSDPSKTPIPVSVAFTGVTRGGGTTVVVDTSVAPLPAPVGYELTTTPPVYFFVTTTAGYGTATVCISENTLTTSSALIHYSTYSSGTIKLDVTAPGYPDLTRIPHEICSKPLTSLSPFAIARRLDATPPVTTAALSPLPNAAGWSNGPVTVTLSATDPDGISDVAEIHYAATGAQTMAEAVVARSSAAISLTTQGSTTVTWFARDRADNTEAQKQVTVQIDQTPPVITYGGNAGTYTVDQTVHINCTAADPLNSNGTAGSGLASTTCANVDSPAYAFAAGINPLSAQAQDVAGNPGSASTSFTVQVTSAGLCVVAEQFIETSANVSALPPLVQYRARLAGARLCQLLVSATVAWNPSQKSFFVSLYQSGVAALVMQGWLNPEQAAILDRLVKALSRSLELRRRRPWGGPGAATRLRRRRRFSEHARHADDPSRRGGKVGPASGEAPRPLSGRRPGGRRNARCVPGP